MSKKPAKKTPAKKEPAKKEVLPGTRIECTYDKLIDPVHLKPNPANPNTHPQEQIDKLAKLIEVHGWRLPIVVSNRSELIVSGHGRLLAAQQLGLTKVPVDFQDFKDEAEELAVMVSDNVIADLSSFAGLKMAEILNELDRFNVDLSAFTALDEEQILNYIHGPGMPTVEGLTDPDDIPLPPDEPITSRGDLWLLGAYTVCPHCKERNDVDD